MGRDFYEQTKPEKGPFDQASELLGFSMPELVFEPNDRLDITEYTQAAMVTTSIAMMKVFTNTGMSGCGGWFKPGRILRIGGGWRYVGRDAITTVRQRGILMQQAVPVGIGSMAAVLAMDAAAIEETIADMDDVQIAKLQLSGTDCYFRQKRGSQKLLRKFKSGWCKRYHH